MSFYEEISGYYDQIFPAGREQINFIREVAGKPPKALLDVACGTGGYSIELAALGYEVTAVDVDRKMIELLEKKSSQCNIKINSIHAGMLDLTGKLDNKYDTVFCIGNSIVHLDGKDEIRSFFKSAKELLNGSGRLVIQTMNFDRVLLKDIRQLPVITDETTGLNFERFYNFDKARNRIGFRTILKVDGKTIENEIPLFPLLSEDAEELLREAGFKRLKTFGDFNGNEFDKYNSYMLVLWAS